MGHAGRLAVAVGAAALDLPSAVLFLTRRSLREIAPCATAVLGVVAGFFLLLMVGWENPFTATPGPPARGQRGSTRCCATRR